MDLFKTMNDYNNFCKADANGVFTLTYKDLFIIP